MNDRVKPVLLVVDESEVRCLLQDIYFSELGMDVESMTDGAAAVAKSCMIRPDVALVSLSLDGELDAEATICALRQYSNVRVIVIGELPAPGDDTMIERGSRALAAGADVLVFRPCMPDVLLGYVRRLLSSHDPGEGVVASGIREIQMLQVELGPEDAEKVTPLRALDGGA